MKKLDIADPPRMGLEARASRRDHLSLRVWLRLLSCSTEIEAEVRRRLRVHFDMSLSRFDYLAQLDRFPEGLTMRALSRCLMVTGGSVTSLTDELEAEGLVMRETPPNDRRSFLIRITPAGKAAFDDVASVHERWVMELLAGLRAAECEQMMHLLGRLRSHLAQTLALPQQTAAAPASDASSLPAVRGTRAPGKRVPPSPRGERKPITSALSKRRAGASR